MGYNRYKDYLKWIGLSLSMNERFHLGSMSYPFFPRGTVISAFLGENVGHEKSMMRPVVVLSNDQLNRKSTNVIIAPLTDARNKVDLSTGKVKLLRSQYLLRKADCAFLSMDSIIQFEDVRSISKERLGNSLGVVPHEIQKFYKNRIKETFGI